MLNCCIICRINTSFQLNECVGRYKIPCSMPLATKWNMFENNVCMSVCMYAITSISAVGHWYVAKQYIFHCCMVLMCETKLLWRLNFFLFFMLSQEIFNLYHPKRPYIGLWKVLVYGLTSHLVVSVCLHGSNLNEHLNQKNSGHHEMSIS